MSPKNMDHDERRRLLQELSRLSPEAESASDNIRCFLPLARHDHALRPETLIIRGPRGSGKTALFEFISNLKNKPKTLARLFPSASLLDVSWLEGFNEKGMSHPQPIVLDQFGVNADIEKLRVFWLTHLVCSLVNAGWNKQRANPSIYDQWQEHLSNPEVWVSNANNNISELAALLDRIEKDLESKNQTIYVQYDHLDKIAINRREIQQLYSGALLALWMSLSNRYRFLKCKIFIRNDLFEASQQAFSDASKMSARSIILDWDVQSLYRLLLRHIANVSTDLAAWLGRGPHSIELTEKEDLGLFPPEKLPEKGRNSQKAFADHLAGEIMGKGVKKGFTYRWIPNHLQDAYSRIVPRSIVNLIAYAATSALEKETSATNDRLLTPAHLMAALEQTSRHRAKELAEEHKIVERLNHLKNQTVLMDYKEVEKLLSKPKHDLEDGFGTNGKAICDELIHLGVLKIRSDGRIDVPDIYRYGYGIKRRGGGKRPR